jgi:hypothetical protein
MFFNNILDSQKTNEIGMHHCSFNQLDLYGALQHIVWYLTCPTPTELGKNKGDGKHRSYLGKEQEYRVYDKKLFDKLRPFQMNDPSRQISVIPSFGIFPSTTVYYDSVLSFSKLPKIGPIAREIRLRYRTDWFAGAKKESHQ